MLEGVSGLLLTPGAVRDQWGGGGGFYQQRGSHRSRDPAESVRFCLFFFFFPHVLATCHTACRILVPQSGIEPASPAVEVQSLTHRTPGKSLMKGLESCFKKLKFYHCLLMRK